MKGAATTAAPITKGAAALAKVATLALPRIPLAAVAVPLLPTTAFAASPAAIPAVCDIN